MKRSRCGGVDEQQSEESNGNLLEDIMAAQTTFTSQYNSFLTLAKQLEGRVRGVEEREKKCEEREKKVQETEKEVERKHEVWQERKQEVKERERDVTRREEMLEEIDNRMKTNAAKLPNVIRFNVGMYPLHNSQFTPPYLIYYLLPPITSHSSHYSHYSHSTPHTPSLSSILNLC